MQQENRQRTVTPLPTKAKTSSNIEVIERVIKSDVITTNEIRVHSPSMLVNWKKSKSDKLNSNKDKFFSFNFLQRREYWENTDTGHFKIQTSDTENPPGRASY